MLPMDVVWRPSTGIGLEHLKLREENQQIYVDSIVVGSVNGDLPARLFTNALNYFIERFCETRIWRLFLFQNQRSGSLEVSLFILC
ncbi:hypothetical protein J31TS6_10500 [Brevibacillus reuszeri]|uniref:hypothetical protein n=1 Tax=Brevibacillus reuszeri TaxID=54915 RepID=UPI001B2B3BB2|nr:hypothetical protein [Brevibacillus reuszeri]GIO05022.1 hypothetical protein J31TS6_10500 [Brevibacillus reuszeri]